MAQPPNWHAFTVKADKGLLRVLQTPCAVCEAHDSAAPPNPPPKFCQFQAIWDTGATDCVITQEVVNTCGLKPVGMAKSHGAHGEKIVEVFLVNLGLPNAVAFENLRVTLGDLPGGSHVLIGMNVISQGDFTVTNQGGNTWFSFRIPSQGHIDYVEVHNRKVFEAKFKHGGKKKKTKKP